MADEYKKLKTWWKAHLVCEYIQDITDDLSERDGEYQLKRDVRRAAEFLEQHLQSAFKARGFQEKYEFMLLACDEASFLKSNLFIGDRVKLFSKNKAFSFQQKFNEMFLMVFGLKDLIAQQVTKTRR